MQQPLPTPPPLTETVTAPPPPPVTVPIPVPQMPAGGQPFQVEKVNDWVDYTTLGVGVFTAILTTAALLVAARTYWRQANDARRQQASKVTFRAVEDNGLLMLELQNGSDQPVYKVRWDLRIMKRPNVITGMTRCDGQLAELQALSPYRTTLEDTYPDPYFVRGSIKFCDAEGKAWERHADGGLSEMKGDSYREDTRGSG